MRSVFVQVDIGDPVIFNRQHKAFAVSQEFYTQIGQKSLGLSGPLPELNTEYVDLLKAAYEANPAWSNKGPFQAQPPSSLTAGKLIIRLLEDKAPKAAENFRCLCSGEKGIGKSSKKLLHYKGCNFHRIVKGFVCQGGDIVQGDGSGGDSIYGGKFNDDKAALKLKHGSIGAVSMANSGKNSNTSQFFVTLAPASKCDGKHVVFGEVTEGLDVLQRIDEEAASADGIPRVPVVISDCGIVK
ncbi:hypothetical protein WJX74_003885 [Apatococcus lobatus]|uniref:Peptidyl-prolyl cis-trans isomerase n=2 Tax=Apatococcus TaxID=904362 RepID=A0AAW1SUT5_9CHLO